MRATLERAGRAALAPAMSLALLLGFPGTSPAATGVLTYADSQGVEHRRENPPDGSCIFFESPAVKVSNGTGTDAALYRDQNCTEFLVFVFKGTRLEFGGDRPQSIKFG
ncbi:hypothetical protein B7P34_00345 [Streptosporangium nondiastaticum]|uniref:Secreted protein n=2 Tax=Actinomycetes TaxID=1760 RepID=A0A9X7JV92_9ACTN|nr:hypothetical protein B7P34_00345 [Streptosporangium nondiastaticum]